MKEKDENSHSDDSYTGKLDLTNNRIDIFRQKLSFLYFFSINNIYLFKKL